MNVGEKATREWKKERRIERLYRNKKAKRKAPWWRWRECKNVMIFYSSARIPYGERVNGRFDNIISPLLTFTQLVLPSSPSALRSFLAEDWPRAAFAIRRCVKLEQTEINFWRTRGSSCFLILVCFFFVFFIGEWDWVDANFREEMH